MPWRMKPRLQLVHGRLVLLIARGARLGGARKLRSLLLRDCKDHGSGRPFKKETLPRKLLYISSRCICPHFTMDIQKGAVTWRKVNLK